MSKRADLIAAGKSGHRVLLFGKKLLDGVTSEILPSETVHIDCIPFPEDYESLGRLRDYTLVVTAYDTFTYGQQTYGEILNIFDKQVLEALDAGTTVCFTHYNEAVPAYDEFACSTAYMDSQHVKACREQQIGFRWLERFSIRPHRADHPILAAHVKRGIFQPFLGPWGASHNYFSTFGERKWDDEIYMLGSDNSAIAFEMDASAGMVLFVPFQRDPGRPKDLSQGVRTLVDCLLTYITKRLVGLPAWAEDPYFEDEKVIRARCHDLEEQLERQDDLLRPFVMAKALLCQAEYALEESVPEFMRENMGLATCRDERYMEDFWLVDQSGEKMAIAEVKSYVKGFKKSGIYDLFNHRESNEMPEAFPAILFVNTWLQGGSWDAKDARIDKQDYEVAAQNNILILRIVDLVRLWDLVRKGTLASDQAAGALTSAKGWLHIDRSLEMETLPE